MEYGQLSKFCVRKIDSRFGSRWGKRVYILLCPLSITTGFFPKGLHRYGSKYDHLLITGSYEGMALHHLSPIGLYGMICSHMNKFYFETYTK